MVAICVLGVIAIITAIGYILLGMNNKTVPEALIGLGSASIGALAGLISPPPKNGDISSSKKK
jgi:hypothetical protein